MSARVLRGPELAAHVRRGMDEIARDAGYVDAAAMCRRLARQGQAYLASPTPLPATPSTPSAPNSPRQSPSGAGPLLPPT